MLELLAPFRDFTLIHAGFAAVIALLVFTPLRTSRAAVWFRRAIRFLVIVFLGGILLSTPVAVFDVLSMRAFDGEEPLLATRAMLIGSAVTAAALILRSLIVRRNGSSDRTA